VRPAGRGRPQASPFPPVSTIRSRGASTSAGHHGLGHHVEVLGAQLDFVLSSELVERASA
jgi:hypothetical protein